VVDEEGDGQTRPGNFRNVGQHIVEVITTSEDYEYMSSHVAP
jgi:hypothetical protein